MSSIAASEGPGVLRYAGSFFVRLIDSSSLFTPHLRHDFCSEKDQRQTLAYDANTGEEPSMVTRILLMLVALGVLSTGNGCYYVEPPPPAVPSYGRYGGPSQGAYREDDRRMKEDEQRAYWQQRRREREYWDRQTAPAGPSPSIPPPPPGPPPPPPPDWLR
jgi:hypothetical protein